MTTFNPSRRSGFEDWKKGNEDNERLSLKTTGKPFLVPQSLCATFFLLVSSNLTLRYPDQAYMVKTEKLVCMLPPLFTTTRV